MKFYNALFSPVPLPPSPDRSIGPSRTVKMKRSMCHDVNFILGWPITWGRRDREALAWPTTRRHCWALIGIWGLCVCMCVTMVSDSNKPQLISAVLRMWQHSIIYTLRWSVGSTLYVLDFWNFILERGNRSHWEESWKEYAAGTVTVTHGSALPLPNSEKWNGKVVSMTQCKYIWCINSFCLKCFG